MYRNYSIHDILKLKIRTSSRSLLKGLNFPLSYFEFFDEVDDSDIFLNVGKFTPSNKGCYLIDHKYYVKKNYFYCQDVSGSAKWKVEIFGFEKLPSTINFDGRIVGLFHYLAHDLLPQETILWPLLELFLGLKGYLLAHGGGITKDDEAFIFLGRGGSLKTTIMLNAARDGYKILGDDRIIIDLENELVYSFPIYHQTFEYMIKNVKREDLNIFQKILLAFYLLKSKKHLAFWERTPVKLRSTYILKRTTKFDGKVNIRTLEKDLAIEKIIANNKAEMHYSSIPSTARSFSNYMLAYSYFFPESRISTYWNDLEKRLKEILNDVSFYEVEIPEKQLPCFNNFLKVAS